MILMVAVMDSSDDNDSNDGINNDNVVIFVADF